LVEKISQDVANNLMSKLMKKKKRKQKKSKVNHLSMEAQNIKNLTAFQPYNF
jgi:hypothetical protein